MKFTKSNLRMTWFTAIILITLCSLPVILSGCEACSKTMSVTGKVTDSATSQPIEGVNVYCCTVGELTTPKTTTAADGTYSFSVGNLGGFSGAKVHFEKTGYTALDATPFTDAEANIDRCDNYSVERNVSLSP